MTQNTQLAKIAILACTFALLLANIRPATANDRPNVLFIFADDQCFETATEIRMQLAIQPSDGCFSTIQMKDDCS